MKLLTLVVVLAVAGFAVGSIDRPFVADQVEFQSWMLRFGKVYETQAEYQQRFQNYLDFKVKVAKLRMDYNQRTGKDGSKVFAITQFADLSQEEFAGRYLNRKPDTSGIAKEIPVANFGSVDVNGDFATKDWRKVSPPVLTPIKNQGQCGSCWAFSTTEGTESGWALAGNPIEPLSVQQIVSCDGNDAGCGGGDLVTAYKYLKSVDGLESEKEYPYRSGGGDNGQCTYKKDKVVVPTAKLNMTYATKPCFGSCDSQDEGPLLAALTQVGPPSICIDASNWNAYGGGDVVWGPDECGAHGYYDLDHCVQLIGVEKKSDGKKYYIVRNSWGESWGNSGTIYLEVGKNTCGIADEAILFQFEQ